MRAIQIAGALLLGAVSAKPYSFVTFGDWGTGSTLQRDGADSVNHWCATDGACEMVVGLADNYYKFVFGWFFFYPCCY